MAYSNVNALIWGNTVAAEDLTGKQYFAGVVDANGEIAVAAVAGGRVDGVINTDSPLGLSADLTLQGVVRVALGGTVAVADALAVDAAGKFVTAATADVVVGKALVGGAAGEVGTAIIYGGGGYSAA